MRPTMPRRTALSLLISIMVLVGCSADAGDFYGPLPDGTGNPGDVVRQVAIASPAGSQARRVVYRSLDMEGNAIGVSGWVAIPDSAGPHPVMVFANGTTGIGDDCAPTRAGGASPHTFTEFLDRGWTVAFTDYQGLGTPGLHHYLVAEAAARSVLDAARAARSIDRDAASEISLFGFSQGGHAVLAATEQARQLAPELEVTASVVAAPAVFLREWFADATPAQIGYLAMMGAAYADAYDMPVEAWLGPAARDH